MLIIRWMFVRIFPFTLLLAGVILVNYQPPSLEWVELLRLDECEPPCWIGITPGRTTVSEAKARILEAFGNQEKYIVQQQTIDAQYNITIRAQNAHLRVGIFGRNRVVESIFDDPEPPGDEETVTNVRLDWDFPPVSLAELSLYLGPVRGLHAYYPTHLPIRRDVRMSFGDGVSTSFPEQPCGYVGLDISVRQIRLNYLGHGRSDWRGFRRCYPQDEQYR